jgi:hypothetical protein
MSLSITENPAGSKYDPSAVPASFDPAGTKNHEDASSSHLYPAAAQRPEVSDPSQENAAGTQ